MAEDKTANGAEGGAATAGLQLIRSGFLLAAFSLLLLFVVIVIWPH